MRMTTPRLILLRLFNHTFGRIGLASRILRFVLVNVMIARRSNGRYVATSRFFTWEQLDEG